MDIRGYLHDSLHSTQWGANLIGWWDTNVINRKTKKDLLAYHKEADDKVWLMRFYDFNTKQPLYEVSRPACERILATYDDIPEDGYEEWERGFWMGILGTLRWVLGDEEKDNLDT